MTRLCPWCENPIPARGPGDTLDDLFPGSGAVTRARAAYTRPPDPLLAEAHDASRNPDLYASSDPDLYASVQARADASSPAASERLLPVV